MKEAKALKVINCQGTDYEIGQQYGKACREIFHLSSERITSFSQQCRISKKQIIANVNEFLPLVENFDLQAIEFIKGIAAGACINFEGVLMIRASMELMFFNAGRIPGLCTSFSATGKAVKSGKTLIGQNLEFFNGTSFAILRIKGLMEWNNFYWLLKGRSRQVSILQALVFASLRTCHITIPIIKLIFRWDATCPNSCGSGLSAMP